MIDFRDKKNINQHKYVYTYTNDLGICVVHAEFNVNFGFIHVYLSSTMKYIQLCTYVQDFIYES